MEYKTKQMSQRKNIKWLKAILGSKLGPINVVNSGMFWANVTYLL